MIILGDGDYTCRAFFPRSLSAVHVETLMRIILQSFVGPLENPPELKRENENEYVAKKAMKLAENSVVAKDGRKKSLLGDWIAQDLCFYTTKKDLKTGKLKPFLFPYTTQVGGLKWKAGRGQEGYDKVFYELMRAARKTRSLAHNEVLENFIRTFDAEGGGVASDLLRRALREVGNKSLEDPEFYEDRILCRPHARLFQQDIGLLTAWKLPRGDQVELLKRLISFHFCAYLVRMAKAADWTMQAVALKLDSPEAYASLEMPCVACRAAYENEASEFENRAAICKFHPRFSVGGEPSQEWHEVLARYHRNVALINLSLRAANLPNRSGARPEDIFNLLRKLSRGTSIAQKIVEECKNQGDKGLHGPRKALEQVLDEKFNSKHPPKGHAWDFFNRFAPSKEAGFMERKRRGRMKAKIAPDLMNAWAHIFCGHRWRDQKSPLFVEFVDFLNARGIKFVGEGIEHAEETLRSMGLLRQYADMGIARVLEPIFPMLNPLDRENESS